MHLHYYFIKEIIILKINAIQDDPMILISHLHVLCTTLTLGVKLPMESRILWK